MGMFFNVYILYVFSSFSFFFFLFLFLFLFPFFYFDVASELGQDYNAKWMGINFDVYFSLRRLQISRMGRIPHSHQLLLTSFFVLFFLWISLLVSWVSFAGFRRLVWFLSVGLVSVGWLIGWFSLLVWFPQVFFARICPLLVYVVFSLWLHFLCNLGNKFGFSLHVHVCVLIAK